MTLFSHFHHSSVSIHLQSSSTNHHNLIAILFSSIKRIVSRLYQKMTTKRRILHLLSFIIILYINLNQVDAFFERTITLNDKSTVSKWEKSYKFLDSINWSKRYGIEKILSDFRNDSSLSKKLSFTCNQFLDQNFHPNENIRNRFYSNENHSKNWGGKFSKHFNQCE